MKRTILLFAVLGLVGMLAQPASARPMVRGETYVVTCEWGAQTVQPGPGPGVLGWDADAPLGSAPVMMVLFRAGIWWSEGDAPDIETFPSIVGLSKQHEVSLCQIHGALEWPVPDQFDIWAYFLAMPNDS
jgi:hypothetical protein